MFSCYTHGWSSALSMCPLCWNQQISITTSTGTFESIVGISGKEIERLRSENARLREALEMIASGESYCGGVVRCKDVAKFALEGK